MKVRLARAVAFALVLAGIASYGLASRAAIPSGWQVPGVVCWLEAAGPNAFFFASAPNSEDYILYRCSPTRAPVGIHRSDDSMRTLAVSPDGRQLLVTVHTKDPVTGRYRRETRWYEAAGSRLRLRGQYPNKFVLTGLWSWRSAWDAAGKHWLAQTYEDHLRYEIEGGPRPVRLVRVAKPRELDPVWIAGSGDAAYGLLRNGTVLRITAGGTRVVARSPALVDLGDLGERACFAAQGEVLFALTSASLIRVNVARHSVECKPAPFVRPAGSGDGMRIVDSNRVVVAVIREEPEQSRLHLVDHRKPGARLVAALNTPAFRFAASRDRLWVTRYDSRTGTGWVSSYPL